MLGVGEFSALIEQSRTGIVPPIGNIELSDEVIGFSFDLYLDAKGQLDRRQSGPVNEALANFIINNEILRAKDMTLQEEIAIAITDKEPKLTDRINVLKSIKRPGKTFNTHELLKAAYPGLIKRQVGSLAVVVFRHQLPRAAAQVKKAGFAVSTPDMSQVGDFNPYSVQPWVRSSEAWVKRERKVIIAFGLLNLI